MRRKVAGGRSDMHHESQCEDEMKRDEGVCMETKWDEWKDW